MKKEILQTIEKYNLINNGDKIVIGVSGGPDSICLLHILNSIKSELGISIYVAHINHMIREVADDETKYVECILPIVLMIVVWIGTIVYSKLKSKRS